MNRVIYALVALITFFAAGPSTSPALGQNSPDPAAEPNQPQSTIYQVNADQTVDNVVVRNQTLILAGHVQHDVLAINCNVIVKPGATVGNYVDLIGGSLDNQAEDSVKVIRQDSKLSELLEGAASPVPSVAKADAAGRWSGAQFALWLLGMLVGLILKLVAPRAAQRSSDTVARERGRCLALGVIGAGVMVMSLLLGSVLLRSPARTFCAPFAAALAIACVGILAFSWLCGVAEVGVALERRLGRRDGHWYSQAIFGLTSFFLISLILGKISSILGVTVLMIEALVTLMGLGGAMISGLGTDSRWLTSRLRGERSWFAREPRL